MRQFDLNEEETRAELIDPVLKEARWGNEITPESRIRREYEFTDGKLVGGGQRGERKKADYLLTYRGKQLAIIEAKRLRLKASEGVSQAKAYAQCLGVRFTYATNGKEIWRIDMETGQEGAVDCYPTPEELWNATFSKASNWRDKFTKIGFETKSGTWQPRYYQYNAIEAALEAIIDDKDRILLTLATGTGKTAISFQIAWKLFHSRWNIKAWRGDHTVNRQARILFLADRNILANQAFSSFSAFDEDAMVRIDPETIRKSRGVPKNGNLFFTIFQTFMTGKKDEDGEETFNYGEYAPDFFDLIIIDECHRGGANDEGNWRKILEYFEPAVQLGLTATPKRKGNVDTYKYFGEPVYTYSLKDGINDGFLTPFRIKRIGSNIDEYRYDASDDIEGEIDAEKTYEEKDFNVSIEIKDRERHRVRTFMSLIDQKEKTLVFCATQPHAAFIRDYINQIKHSTQPNYCTRVAAADGKAGETFLKQFQDNEKTIPTILTTSRKLSTGVDARNVRNIVLLRPVNSMIEFKQIIGRGTRLYDFKDYFTLYDFVKAYDHFNDDEWDGDPEPCEICEQLACICESKPCKKCGEKPCICPPSLCKKCGESPCICEADGVGEKGGDYLPEEKIQVTLSDKRKLAITNVIATEFLGEDGKPITPEEYLKQFYDDLPAFFKDEEQLREIWSQPDTRQNLLSGLQAKGYSLSQLNIIRNMLGDNNCDLFDVLAHLAYELPIKSRAERIKARKEQIYDGYNDKQQEFIDFVLDHYVDHGVNELAQEKLKTLIKLKYQTPRDIPTELGKAAGGRKLFWELQERLYLR